MTHDPKRQPLGSLAKPNTPKTAALATFQTEAIEVDRDNGVIRNVAIITAGEAHGHGFSGEVDADMLQAFANGINAKNGVKSRVTHVEVETGGDDILERVGMVKNARVTGDQVRGDVYLGKYAKSSPHGNLWDYILDLADEAPDLFGLSVLWSIYDGPESISAVDIVGTPAANPSGLLSQGSQEPKPTEGGSEMNPKLRKYLESIGLDTGATEDEAKEFMAKLEGDQKAQADTLSVEPEAEPEPEPEPEAEVVAEQPEPAVAAASQNVDKAVQAALARERKRISGIRALAQKHDLNREWADGLIERGATLEHARELVQMNQDLKPIAGLSGRGQVHVGKDRKLAGLSGDISDAICLRAGAKVDQPSDRAEKFRGLRVLDMFRQYLAALGCADAHFLGHARLANLLSPRALRRAYPEVAALAMSTDDFDNILADTINKSLLRAYEDAPRTWNRWCRRATAPDFKTITRAALSESPDLSTRSEGNEINYVTLSDSKETYTLVEYAGGIRLTRQAMINDDLDAFNRIPMLQAMAAARKEDDVAYAILTANANMSDGGALFNATVVTTAGGHANRVDSGGAIDVAEVAATEKLMRLQKGPKLDAYLDIMPRYILCPVAMDKVAQQFIASVVDPAKSNATPNPYANRFEVISNPRLDANSSVIWYMAADPQQWDTVEVCFLEEEPAPVLGQETDFDTDDMKFKVRHTVAAKAIDWRGLVQNDGE